VGDVAMMVCDVCMTAEFVPARDKAVWQSYHQHEDDE
jgi:hypothetical protein